HESPMNLAHSAACSRLGREPSYHGTTSSSLCTSHRSSAWAGPTGTSRRRAVSKPSAGESAEKVKVVPVVKHVPEPLLACDRLQLDKQHRRPFYDGCHQVVRCPRRGKRMGVEFPTKILVVGPDPAVEREQRPQ